MHPSSLDAPKSLLERFPCPLLSMMIPNSDVTLDSWINLTRPCYRLRSADFSPQFGTERLSTKVRLCLPFLIALSVSGHTCLACDLRRRCTANVLMPCPCKLVRVRSSQRAPIMVWRSVSRPRDCSAPKNSLESASGGWESRVGLPEWIVTRTSILLAMSQQFCQRTVAGWG